MDLKTLLALNNGFADEIRHFIKCWQGQAETHTPPDYMAFSPTSLRRQLSHTVMFEMDAAGGIRFRLCGSEVERFFSRSLTNVHLSDLFHNIEEAEAINELFALATIHGLGLIRITRRTIDMEPNPICFANVCLPMTHSRAMGGNLLLGLIFTSGQKPWTPEEHDPKNDDRKISDEWEGVTLINISTPYRDGLLSDKTKAFIQDQDIDFNTIHISDFQTLIDDHSQPQDAYAGFRRSLSNLALT